MAIQLESSDEIMVVQSVQSSTEIQVLRGAFDTPVRRSAGNDDKINILGRVDDLVCAPSVCDIDNITSTTAGANYSSCDGKQSGEVCTVACFEGYAGVDTQGQTVDSFDVALVCDGNGDFEDTSGFVCQANTCDGDDIANAVAYADYSSCAGETSGGICNPFCIPGYRPVTNASKPINLVCDADGDFIDPIELTGPAVSNVARLNASLANFSDLATASLSSSAGFSDLATASSSSSAGCPFFLPSLPPSLTSLAWETSPPEPLIKTCD